MVQISQKIRRMKVLTVVLNFNSQKYIGECLDSLIKTKTEILLVEGGSTDNSVEYLKTNYSELKLISTNKNLGYAGGNNVGLKYALEHKYDFVWIVNPDIVVDSKALDEAMKVITKDDRTAVVASKVYFAPGFEFHKNRYSKKELGKVIWYAGGDNDWKNVFATHYGMNEVDKGQFDKEREVGHATGSSMLIRCETLKVTGIIDEKYFLYYEENDLCQRIRKAGFKLMYAPRSVVWHKVGQAAGIGSPLADYYITRSRLMFGMRWAPFKTKLSLIKESLKLLFFGRTWQKIGIRDFYLRKFGKGSYA